MSQGVAYLAPARWSTVDGQQTPASYTSLEQEVQAIREGVAISDRSYVCCLRLAGDDVYDWLDQQIPIELYLNDGQIRHTLLLDDNSMPLADVYLCNDDEEYLWLSEGMTPSATIAHLQASIPEGIDAQIHDLNATHSLLALNGPFAWELLKTLEGASVLGFPFMTCYHPSTDRTYFRAGKTGEFGYDLLLPHDQKEAVWSALMAHGESFDLVPAGFEALEHCGFENFFYSPHIPGFAGLSPLELQLQWRLSYHKEYPGSQALQAQRAAGSWLRITAFTCADELPAEAEIRLGDQRIGLVCHVQRALGAERWNGVALLDMAYAHSGIDAYTAQVDGAPVPIKTASPPFVDNLSLVVDPRLHTYHERHQLLRPARLAG